MKPIRDFVAVEKIESDKKTHGGIYMPDVVEDKIVQANVVAVGSGHLNKDGGSIPLEVKEGDRVMFNRSSGVEVKVGERNLFLVREENIICKSEAKRS